MKFVIELNGNMCVANTRRAKLLCAGGKKPLYRYYKQGECYFRTTWYKGEPVSIIIFDNLNHIISNIATHLDNDTAIEVFNLKEVDKVQKNKVLPGGEAILYTGKRNIQFGNHG